MKLNSWFRASMLEVIVSSILFLLLFIILIASYYHYVSKLYYKDIISIAATYQSAVANCLKLRHYRAWDCNAGQYGIPANLINGFGVIGSVFVVHGAIMVTPQQKYGIKSSDTYILTPLIISPPQIDWVISGGGCDDGLSQSCS